jgi:hypothetical protein
MAKRFECGFKRYDEDSYQTDCAFDKLESAVRYVVNTANDLEYVERVRVVDNESFHNVTFEARWSPTNRWDGEIVPGYWE